MHILVVDDDSLAAGMAAAVLNAAGHNVIVAESGAQALAELAQQPTVDLVVSDLNMPEMSGLDLFRVLRGRGLDLPFVLLTADDPAPLLAAEPGLDGCLPKGARLLASLGREIGVVMARRGGA